MSNVDILDRIFDVLESRPMPENQLQHNVRFSLAAAVILCDDPDDRVQQVRLMYQDWMRRTAQVCDDQTEMMLSDIGQALEANP